jgi:membrane-associated phospholipid phosphatase
MQRALPPFLAAAACGVAAWLVWLVASQTDWGAWLDARTAAGFAGLERPRVEPTAERVAAIVDPAGFALLASLVVGTAVVRGRIRLACVVAVVLVAANLTTQALKRGVPAGDEAIALLPVPGTWPSGHATAAMVLALCAVLVAPARARPVVAACGGLFAVAVAYSVLILQRHHPSDVLGAYLIAAGWTALGVVVLNATGARSAAGGWDERAGPAARAAGVAAVLALSLVVGFVLTRPDEALAYAGDYTVFVAGAPALAAAALAVATVTAAAVREG